VRQLPLGVTLNVAARFATYVAGENADTVTILAGQDGDSHLPALWLAGPVGVGKTHLLQALCARAGEQGRRAAYLPLHELRHLGPEALEGLESLDLVCLDDLELVLTDAGWERRLFVLYNALIERGSLVCAASQPPAALAIDLPDLASRLRAAAVFRLAPLPEALQGTALEARARHRGLELPPESLQYLLRRAPRDFQTLCRILDELDAAQLAAQRRLTVPLVRETLERYGL
jgi:DnaA-homolog protein